MKDVRLVVFDLDGTLIDAYRAIYRSFNFTMRAVGYPEQEETVICRAVGWGDRQLLQPFVKAGDLDKALDLYRRHHAQSLLKGIRLFPGVRRLLTSLKKRGYKLAVASNRPTRFSLIILKQLNIRSFFDFVLCGDKVEKGKPDPGMLRIIMGKLRNTPLETLYVGDMFIDIQAAKRAGVRSVAVTTGSSTRAELKRERPDKILREVSGLLKLLPGCSVGCGVCG